MSNPLKGVVEMENLDPNSMRMRDFMERARRHQGHEKHLCRLVSERQMATVADLVKAPRFMCNVCGRGAADSKNLCEPVRLED